MTNPANPADDAGLPDDNITPHDLEILAAIKCMMPEEKRLLAKNIDDRLIPAFPDSAHLFAEMAELVRMMADKQEAKK